MSNTIAQRPHVHHHHVPLLPVLAVIVTIVIAAAVVYAVNQAQEATITTTGGEAITTPVVAPGVVPVPESPVFRHSLMSTRLSGVEVQVFKYGRLHQVDGTTLDAAGTMPYGSTTYEQFDRQR